MTWVNPNPESEREHRERVAGKDEAKEADRQARLAIARKIAELVPSVEAGTGWAATADTVLKLAQASEALRS